MTQPRFLTTAAALVAISGLTFGATPKKKSGDWPMWGGSSDRNMISHETGIPGNLELDPNKNLKWTSKLGSQSYGNPVVVDGRIYIGTNNNAEHRPQIKGDKGVIVCLEEKSGKLLWQATHDKLTTGRVNDWPEQGICSSPVVEGKRIYYVSNRCTVVCADAEGFLDGENDGPYTKEKYNQKEDGDFIWIYDMIGELGAFPHNLATCSPVMMGDMLLINTSNGVDEGHLDIPAPNAASFLALNKNTGKLVWESSLPGADILHGQWSSPAAGMIGGVPQAIFAGGDGWCYSLAPDTGKLLWKFDLNPKGSKWKLGGRGTKNNIIATPVIYDDKVYLCVGQDPEHGEGPGHLYAIDATKRGDITESGKVWHVGGKEFRRSMSTVAIADGLLYASDLSGFLYCLDLKTGQRQWRHDTFAAVWGSPYVVDGKVYLGDEDGEMVVLKHGRELQELGIYDLKDAVYTTPVASNGVLYVVNRNTLFAFKNK